MAGHSKWSEVRARHVARAGGEDAMAAGKHELLAEVRPAGGCGLINADFGTLDVPNAALATSRSEAAGPTS